MRSGWQMGASHVHARNGEETEELEGLLRRRDCLKGHTMSGKFSTAVWVQNAAWLSTEAWSVSMIAELGNLLTAGAPGREARGAVGG